MSVQHTTTAMEALLAKVDTVLTGTGTDPATVTDDDKIMLAVQYIEVITLKGIFLAHSAELFRL